MTNRFLIKCLLPYSLAAICPRSFWASSKLPEQGTTPLRRTEPSPRPCSGSPRSNWSGQSPSINVLSAKPNIHPRDTWGAWSLRKTRMISAFPLPSPRLALLLTSRRKRRSMTAGTLNTKAVLLSISSSALAPISPLTATSLGAWELEMFFPQLWINYTPLQTLSKENTLAWKQRRGKQVFVIHQDINSRAAAEMNRQWSFFYEFLNFSASHTFNTCSVFSVQTCLWMCLVIRLILVIIQYFDRKSQLQR